jgi:hypothetical protein
MILDKLNQYADAQTLAASGASTNVIDHGSDRNIGLGEPLALVITVTACVSNDGDETYAFVLQSDADEAFGSAGTVIPSQSITRGTTGRFIYYLPKDVTTERYTRLSWTLGGTTPSITYSAELVRADHADYHGATGPVTYPGAYNVE